MRSTVSITIVEDMIGTGETLSHAVVACRKGGARKVFAAITHGFFYPGSEAAVANPDLDGILVNNTLPPFRELCAKVGDGLTG
jgi:ribose-phosphate pyrophosphokinase